ncbi:10685_t:CDS:1, partial [Dentiscutata heterogama]
MNYPMNQPPVQVMGGQPPNAVHINLLLDVPVQRYEILVKGQKDPFPRQQRAGNQAVPP